MADADPGTIDQQRQTAGNNNTNKGSNDHLTSTEYLLKKYLLMLATLVATVTYGAGLNLPGGSWLVDNAPAGQVAGDSILRGTNYRRYIVFYSFNAISFAASLLLGLLLLVLQREGSQEYLLLMWTVMLVDGLALMGAYAAGISHDKFTTISASVLVSGVGVYAASAFACYLYRRRHLSRLLFRSSCGAAGNDSNQTQNHVSRGIQTDETAANSGDESKKPTEKHEMLLVLAIFVATIAYVAGLNPPGGFWRSTEEGQHTAGDPVLQRLHPNRYKAFFFCNTIAFVTSLLAIMHIVDYRKFNLEDKLTPEVVGLYVLIITSLMGLGGAYAAGSCRDGKHTGYVIALNALVIACMAVVPGFQYIISALCRPLTKKLKDSKFMRIWNGEDENATDENGRHDAYEKLHEYIQLLATLAATITYLAGLDPPGGVWASSGEGHSVGDPILLTTHPARYKVFFYFNSVAFVASLVIVVMLQKTNLVRSGHALLAALILDFFSLIGAYAAGSCRDTSTTIYTVAIAGAVLIYVVIHIVFFTLDIESSNEDELERKRELLMLLAVLAATLAYQAGLTPPGGLWEEDDDKVIGHHRAGFPVLQDKYPRRYEAFFYCNAASFMASVALIILLLNKNMYKPGIRCYALYVCMVAGMFGLIGAYAAGSSLHRRSSIVFLVLVAAGIGIVTWLAILRYGQHHRKKHKSSNKDKMDQQQSSNEDKDKDGDLEGQNKNQHNKLVVIKDKDSVEGLEAKIKQEAEHMAYYLMLVGILAASITYLTGLKPPGGTWKEDGDGHSAGNPVLYDINKRRYNVFFYSNSASFVASIIVIALLLSRMMLPVSAKENFVKSLLTAVTSLRRVHTAIVLDVLALLVAYAAGTSRESRRSWKVIMLFPIEVLVVIIFCFISIIRKAYLLKPQASPSQRNTTPKT